MSDHLDAIISVVLVAGGALLVHMKTVGKLLQAVHELDKDVKDLGVGMRRMNKRFHFLNNFVMGLYATVRQVAQHQKIELVEIPLYDFEKENGGD